MSKFKEFIKENIDIDKKDFYKKENIEAIPYIEKLIKFEWSNGKKMQRESARCFSKLAESDDPLSNKFLKEVDSFCTNLKDKYLKEEPYKFQLMK